jgi:hypothetical protein
MSGYGKRILEYIISEFVDFMDLERKTFEISAF